MVSLRLCAIKTVVAHELMFMLDINENVKLSKCPEFSEGKAQVPGPFTSRIISLRRASDR